MSIVHDIKLPAYDCRLWILFFGMALNQFGMSIVMPFISIYLYYYQGFSGLTNALGFAVGPLVGGILLDHLPSFAMWLIVAAAGVACALGFIYLKKLVPGVKNGSRLAE
jgi:MFS family permease